jgi:hypothetical protein
MLRNSLRKGICDRLKVSGVQIVPSKTQDVNATSEVQLQQARICGSLCDQVRRKELC